MASFRKVRLPLGADDIHHMKVSFSQHGEDLLIADHLMNRPGKPRGIYIDAGCFDPVRFSNTRLLSLHGWHGINVDAGTDVIQKFKLCRPEDENVCAALSDRESDMVLRGAIGHPGRRLVQAEGENGSPGAESVRTTTLAAIFGASRFRDEPVDLLDIDCECHDIEVLRGFPFAVTRPLLVCVEAHTRTEADGLENELRNLDYVRIAVRGPTFIFRDRKSIPPDPSGHIRFSEL